MLIFTPNSLRSINSLFIMLKNSSAEKKQQQKQHKKKNLSDALRKNLLRRKKINTGSKHQSKSEEK